MFVQFMNINHATCLLHATCWRDVWEYAISVPLWVLYSCWGDRQKPINRQTLKSLQILVKGRKENKERNEDLSSGVYFRQKDIVLVRGWQNIKWMLNKRRMLKGPQRYQKVSNMVMFVFPLRRWWVGNPTRGLARVLRVGENVGFKPDWRRQAGNQLTVGQPVRDAKLPEHGVEILNSALPVLCAFGKAAWQNHNHNR